MEDSLAEISKAVTELEIDRVEPLVREALAQGAPAPSVLEAMTSGMVAVGGLFEQGEYFLADLVVAAEAMKDGLKLIEPLLAAESLSKKGTVVLCTVSGDVHDIGKNLVAHMLGSAGFEVVDLGVDVPAQGVVDAVRRHQARAVGLSVLLTPMVPSVAEVVAALSAVGLRDQVKIVIGGACTTEALAQRLGVDAVGRDAVQAVQIFESFITDAAD